MKAWGQITRSADTGSIATTVQTAIQGGILLIEDGLTACLLAPLDHALDIGLDDVRWCGGRVLLDSDQRFRWT